jgi:hypothetical protein
MKSERTKLCEYIIPMFSLNRRKKKKLNMNWRNEKVVKMMIEIFEVNDKWRVMIYLYEGLELGY